MSSSFARQLAARARERFHVSTAEKYRILQAEVESTDKAALAYRDFVCAAVRRHCVLELGEFRKDAVETMALEAGFPEAGRDGVVAYVREQLAGPMKATSSAIS